MRVDETDGLVSDYSSEKDRTSTTRTRFSERSIPFRPFGPKLVFCGASLKIIAPTEQCDASKIVDRPLGLQTQFGDPRDEKMTCRMTRPL
jgi:hypothetical protein